MGKTFEDTPMYKGLVMLNDYLEKTDCEPVSLNVIGGFAMIVHGFKDAYATDIDYVGKNAFDDEAIYGVIDRIGAKVGLTRGWINNDVMLSGTTLEDLEVSTGKLHFHDAFDLSRIHVAVLDAKDLLRMKVLAVDTALTAVEHGGDFTRMKDLPDIAVLMDSRKLDVLGLELETYRQCEIADRTYELIADYLKTRDIGKTMEKYLPKEDTDKKKSIQR